MEIKTYIITQFKGRRIRIINVYLHYTIFSMNKYEDIINLSRPKSKHPQMTLEQRSAQFVPFAALTGYEGQIKETARLTDKKLELDEETKSILDTKIQIIKEKLNKRPQIGITYFVPDNKKEGGKYITITNSIQKIDEYNNMILMSNNIKIKIDEIIDIQGDIFNEFLL